MLANWYIWCNWLKWFNDPMIHSHPCWCMYQVKMTMKIITGEFYTEQWKGVGRKLNKQAHDKAGGHVEQGKEWKKTRASHTLMTRRMYKQSDKFPRVGQHCFSCPEEQPTSAAVYRLMNQSINATCKQEVYGFRVCAWVHFLLHLSHRVRGKVHSVPSPSMGGFL